jgi:hypothetical protein
VTGTLIYDLKAASEWRRALAALPENMRDVYYTPEYFSLCAGGGEALCFHHCRGGHSALYPFIMSRVESPALDPEGPVYHDIEGVYGYNGAVYDSADPDFAESFSRAFDSFLAERNVIAEFTRFHPPLRNHLFPRRGLKIFFNRKTVTLDLSPGAAAVREKSYDAKNRNMIRKALKNGLSPAVSDSPEAFADFHRLYTRTMERLLAEEFYFFDAGYFERARTVFPGTAFVARAESAGETAAAALVLTHGIYAHYHLSARDERLSSLGAGNLALDAAVEEAAARGCRVMHFGGGRGTDGDDPLLRFKAGFSKDRTDFYLGTGVINRPVYDKVSADWERRNPESAEKFGHILLKYKKK